MTPFAKLVSVGAAVVGTASAASIAYVALVSSQPGTATVPAPSSGHTARLIVCVGQDDVLRAFPQSQGCPSAQAPVPIAPPATTSDSSRGSGSAAASPDARIADLEQRLAALRRQSVFTVVNSRGRVIFGVGPGSAGVYDGHGNEVAALRAERDRGAVWAASTDRSTEAYTDASTATAGFGVLDKSVPRATLQRQETGTVALKIYSVFQSTDPIAGIGQSRAGTGALVLGTDKGEARASARIVESRGDLAVFNSGSNAIVSLRQAQAGPGVLILGNALGREAVRMVVTDNRYGAVLAGPTLGFPYVPASGLPGSYFLGCAGGDRCKGF